MSESALSFSILTLNTRSIPLTKSRLRLRAIAEELESSNLSLVNFQEVHTFTHLLLLRRHMSSFPYLSFSRALYGPYSGLVTFSKIPIASHRFLRFSKLGALYNKSIIARIVRNGILITELAEQEVVILNTHLTPNTDSNWSSSNRFIPYIEKQIIQLAEITNNLIEDGKQVIIAGDFNVPKDTRLYKLFLERTGAIDLFSAFDFPTYHGEFLIDGQRPRRIDYVLLAGNKASSASFTSSHLFTKKVKLGGIMVYPSDHIGLKTSVLL